MADLREKIQFKPLDSHSLGKDLIAGALPPWILLCRLRLPGRGRGRVLLKITPAILLLIGTRTEKLHDEANCRITGKATLIKLEMNRKFYNKPYKRRVHTYVYACVYTYYAKVCADADDNDGQKLPKIQRSVCHLYKY
jgi:hypothetical protein